MISFSFSKTLITHVNFYPNRAKVDTQRMVKKRYVTRPLRNFVIGPLFGGLVLGTFWTVFVRFTGLWHNSTRPEKSLSPNRPKTAWKMTKNVDFSEFFHMAQLKTLISRCRAIFGRFCPTIFRCGDGCEKNRFRPIWCSFVVWASVFRDPYQKQKRPIPVQHC